MTQSYCQHFGNVTHVWIDPLNLGIGVQPKSKVGIAFRCAEKVGVMVSRGMRQPGFSVGKNGCRC